MAESAQSGVLFINPIIFAEVSTGFTRREDVTAALDALDFEYVDLPWDAAFIAGKAFTRYRRNGGVRRSPLPDFYIGAHALVSGMALLTRDGSRYRTNLLSEARCSGALTAAECADATAPVVRKPQNMSFGA